MYVTILNRTEREFWSSTLRKVISQINIHTDLYKKDSEDIKNSRKDNKEYEVLKVI